MPAIYTIGHSNRSIDEFIDLLQHIGIRLLVDIRRHPGSRREPQFNPAALRALLADAGIGYLHLEALGGRRKPASDSANTTWRNESFRGYADYMETDEFQHGLRKLMELARSRKTAIMCAEALWWRCHRSMVADALLANGWQVLHIMGNGELAPHRFTEPARLVDGTLSYRPVETENGEEPVTVVGG